MPPVRVHLCPALLDRAALPGSVAVVIDALRATTTVAAALAAGCAAVHPCAEIDEARRLARTLPAPALLAGERDGVPVPGFDLGNSPAEYTAERCRGARVVMTTSNGTRALLAAAAADDVVLACLNNLSAVCELLRAGGRPVNVVCAGDAGAVALEDALVAGAIAHRLGAADDAAALAEAAYLRHRGDLLAAFASCRGGLRLASLGYDEDVRHGARVDTLALVPRLARDPLRVVADLP